MLQKIKVFLIFLIIPFFFYSCITYTKSGNTNLNRNIMIKAVSGNVNLNISGHISENIYYYNQKKHDDMGNKTETLMVLQGKETIKENIILFENNEFKYSMTTAEVVIVNIRSVDDNDAKILVFEYGKNKEYIIYGNNNLGQMLSFKN